MADRHDEIPDDEILPEYSLKGAVRGKYARRYEGNPRIEPQAPDSTAAGDDDDAIADEAHRRYLELESGEAEGIDGDEVLEQLRARRRR